MNYTYEEPLRYYPYPTALGYRCWDGKEWHDCDKKGKPVEERGEQNEF